MKHLFIVVAAALLLAPAAFAKGGAVSHVYAPPPLDAGSAVPNPDYFSGGKSTGIRPDDRASWGTVHGVGSRIVAVQSEADGFDWGDAGIGAAGAVAIVLVGVGSALTLRRNRHGAATA